MSKTLLSKTQTTDICKILSQESELAKTKSITDWAGVRGLRKIWRNKQYKKCWVPWARSSSVFQNRYKFWRVSYALPQICICNPRLSPGPQSHENVLQVLQIQHTVIRPHYLLTPSSPPCICFSSVSDKSFASHSVV